MDQRRGGAGCGACTRHRRGCAGRIYLLGQRELFASDDGGRSFSRVPAMLPEGAEMTALAVAREPKEMLLAVIDGALMASEDGGRQWRRRADGLGDEPIDTVVLDPSMPDRVWAAGGGPHPRQRRSGRDLACGRTGAARALARTCAASQPIRPRPPWS